MAGIVTRIFALPGKGVRVNRLDVFAVVLIVGLVLPLNRALAGQIMARPPVASCVLFTTTTLASTLLALVRLMVVLVTMLIDTMVVRPMLITVGEAFAVKAVIPSRMLLVVVVPLT